MRALLLAAALTLSAAPALADAPQPRRSIDISRFTGSWHEAVRTPNPRQRPCVATRMQISGSAPNLRLTQTCVRSQGEPRTINASMSVVDRETNAKVNMRVTGGIASLISQEYWILDRADDYSWVIMGTPGGNYVWGWTRSANPSAGVRQALMNRIAALGYNTSRLERVG
ncbi:lipocalin family protein [Brevundimonas sp. 2R-24]|uniref:Outer membrane lipoprotein Blc n=1 Tax=Peiella sedimenti TaxID=3061083 RepID=A0ABT8SLK3_9CAUL|nr:lipocalin family protein [Caulobacteraceae bacterium XZ-24]